VKFYVFIVLGIGRCYGIEIGVEKTKVKEL
jgi:hypothetical protein